VVVVEITVVEEEEVEVGVEAGMTIPGISRRNGCELRIVLVWGFGLGWDMLASMEGRRDSGRSFGKTQSRKWKEKPEFRECYWHYTVCTLFNLSKNPYQ
jgi:hypothetical protein